MTKSWRDWREDVWYINKPLIICVFVVLALISVVGLGLDWAWRTDRAAEQARLEPSGLSVYLIDCYTIWKDVTEFQDVEGGCDFRDSEGRPVHVRAPYYTKKGRR